MLDYVKIGSIIRSLRKAKGMSQEQLAERIWISTTHMSHIETGSTKLSLQVLVDLATILEVNTDNLIFEKTPGNIKRSKFGCNECMKKHKSESIGNFFVSL